MNDVPVVSLETAALLLGISKRTLWRRLSAGQLQRHGVGEQGRVMLALADLSGRFCVPFDLTATAGGDIALLVAADQGDSEAQNELALLFLEHERPDIAFHWLSLAAQQQHADAMHYLSLLYQQGLGVERCDNEAMLWRAKAASVGHLIARAQMSAITGTERRL